MFLIKLFKSRPKKLAIKLVCGNIFKRIYLIIKLYFFETPETRAELKEKIRIVYEGLEAKNTFEFPYHSPFIVGYIGPYGKELFLDATLLIYNESIGGNSFNIRISLLDNFDAKVETQAIVSSTGNDYSLFNCFFGQLVAGDIGWAIGATNKTPMKINTTIKARIIIKSDTGYIDVPAPNEELARKFVALIYNQKAKLLGDPEAMTATFQSYNKFLESLTAKIGELNIILEELNAKRNARRDEFNKLLDEHNAKKNAKKNSKKDKSNKILVEPQK